ncbi:beta-galactosidase GalB [Pinibacter soli]|uniref:Beta-galactosidase GalB n=1 Tax=Pinibacter soli TaxID=3044211 RepID=A0ABT6RH07_9BACT|nr:beta-galactosidase GalB [Pinibacter soli]MDI3321823.1 beta-galactosidase GalB [Pinibacter soli]
MNLPLIKRISLVLLLFVSAASIAQTRNTASFNSNWKFYLGNATDPQSATFNDASWRSLDLPHDWSIELPFDSTSPTGTGGGALRGGLGWYRKTFTVPATTKGKKVFVDFDGVYMNSEVFINGHSLGVRPNGFISFRYDLTPYLHYGNEKNIIAVKVDNSKQPNSRWYSGSGIYRNVWLTTVSDVFVDHWGTHITTPQVDDQSAKVVLTTTVNNAKAENGIVLVKTSLYDATSKIVGTSSNNIAVPQKGTTNTTQQFLIAKPNLWSVDRPYLYKAVTQILENGKVIDEYTTTFGVRYFNFDIDKGFFLNGKHLKIRGVCDHHDLGCLGAAVNTRALERQLQILKDMGCNAIRTSHNPPAPELLDLCDKMGFVVMDEAFDMWKKEKNPYDYHLYWDEWHKKDLTDQVMRDRNHPSVFIWSVGNEIIEQWDKDGDTLGAGILRELVSIVKSLDDSRPTVTANNEPNSYNALLKTNATDLIGYNYHHNDWDSAIIKWYRKPFIVTESVSALQTRGHYDMPSDSIRRWPQQWDKPLTDANADLTCSAYENCATPWGSTHEETLKVFEKLDHVSGMFIWTGFDYIGEPTPYPWPARSSYFGIVDLAGFPKDSYYLYQSVWTDKPVLHILPHWNWKPGQTIDMWAYYNNADEVELFVNGKSLGVKKKTGDDLHVMWRTTFVPGTLKAVSRRNGKVVLTKEVRTAGAPAKITLQVDRKAINAGDDLSFVTVRIEDKDGNLVPDASNDVQFKLSGGGSFAGVDNGCQTSMESFKADHRKAFNGLCLAVVKAAKAGKVTLTATSPGLSSATVNIDVK